jgi:hypothetical protein
MNAGFPILNQEWRRRENAGKTFYFIMRGKLPENPSIIPAVRNILSHSR